MKVLVCGGRAYWNDESVNQALDEIRPSVVIQGGAPGADHLAKTWAVRHDVETMTYLPDWTTHGRKAGPLRNKEMLKAQPDLVLAFPGGKGTADMVRQARAAGVEVREVKE